VPTSDPDAVPGQFKVSPALCQALLPERFLPEGAVNTWRCELRAGHIEKHQVRKLAKVAGRFPDDGIVQWDDETDLDRVARRGAKPEVSARAKGLWEALQNVAGNEKAWEIIQEVLDKEALDAIPEPMAGVPVKGEDYYVPLRHGDPCQFCGQKVGSIAQAYEAGRNASDHHAADRGRPVRGPEVVRAYINADHPCCIPVGDAVAILAEMDGWYRMAMGAQKGRRERIASAVLAGLAARGTSYNLAGQPQHEALPYGHLSASIAVTWADALIAELDK